MTSKGAKRKKPAAQEKNFSFRLCYFATLLESFLATEMD
jgi:hypothetical protein